MKRLILVLIYMAAAVTVASAQNANVAEARLNCTDGGSTDAYACNLSPAIPGYRIGVHYRFKANTANTGAATINLNGRGAKTIKKVIGGITTDLADNDIRAGQWVDVVYDGTNMQMQSMLGNAPGGAPTGSAGGDLGGTYPNPTVTQARGLLETAGPTTLTMGAVADGEFLKRSGSTVVGATAGAGTVTTTGSPANGNLTKFSGASTITNADLTGDVTTSGALATTIANDAVTYAKMQNVSAASKLLGRGDSGSGDPQEITLGSGLTMTGTTLSASGGTSTFLGGGFEQYRLMGFNKNPGSTTNTTAIGISAITPFAANGNAANDDADGAWIRWRSGASTNAAAGHDWNNSGLTQTSWLPQITTKAKTYTSVSVCRIWIGAFSADPASSNDPASHALGFRFSTSAGDTTWQAYSNDGSGGGQITNTGVTVSINTTYLFAIRVESTSSVKFYISTDNGSSFSLVATHSTNLPTSTQGMNYWFEIITLENVEKDILGSWTYIRQL